MPDTLWVPKINAILDGRWAMGDCLFLFLIFIAENAMVQTYFKMKRFCLKLYNTSPRLIRKNLSISVTFFRFHLEEEYQSTLIYESAIFNRHC